MLHLPPQDYSLLAGNVSTFSIPFLFFLLIYHLSIERRTQGFHIPITSNRTLCCTAISTFIFPQVILLIVSYSSSQYVLLKCYSPPTIQTPQVLISLPLFPNACICCPFLPFFKFGTSDSRIQLAMEGEGRRKQPIGRVFLSNLLICQFRLKTKRKKRWESTHPNLQIQY